MLQVSIRDQFGEYRIISIENLPEQCPYCHHSINPRTLTGFCHSETTELDIFFNCPRRDCNKSFIGYYELSGQYAAYDFSTSMGTTKVKNFDPVIKDVSPGFVKIYNQAYVAEQENLLEICGVGYRKSLEFLIKDYSIKKYPEQQDVIERKLLAQCINAYVSDTRIKSVATRAVWLGNDETHFVRKWEDKNLVDLKRLIDLTLHWIEAEALSDLFELEMPT